MEPIPMEWVDKVFVCMADFYGNRWSKRFEKADLELLNKTMWRSALHGLSYEQIKQALKVCKRHSQDPRVIPPHQLEFYRYAKQESQPDIDYHPDAGKTGDPEIAKDHLRLIRSKLRC